MTLMMLTWMAIFLKDDLKTYIKAFSKKVESKKLERSILEAVCNENVDELMETLFHDFLENKSN